MNNSIEIIGIDHGWSQMKTSNYCFNTSIKELPNVPAFTDNVLQYDNMMMQSYMQMAQTTQQEAPKENETKDVSEEEDATLQEMSLMFAQGEFGKE